MSWRRKLLEKAADLEADAVAKIVCADVGFDVLGPKVAVWGFVALSDSTPRIFGFFGGGEFSVLSISFIQGSIGISPENRVYE
jgi:hypothetical protein